MASLNNWPYSAEILTQRDLNDMTYGTHFVSTYFMFMNIRDHKWQTYKLNHLYNFKNYAYKLYKYQVNMTKS